MNKLGTRSKGNLKDLNIRMGLVIGMVLARNKVDLTIIDGHRTPEEQLVHFKNGASKLDGTNKISYHQSGNAIDFMPFPWKGWGDKEGFRKVWDELSFCARHLGYAHGEHISWDGGHFELR